MNTSTVTTTTESLVRWGVWCQTPRGVSGWVHRDGDHHVCMDIAEARALARTMANDGASYHVVPYIDGRSPFDLACDAAAIEQRMSNLLSTVERPGPTPEGAPGSLHRRAWELGQTLAAHVRAHEEDLETIAELRRTIDGTRDALTAALAKYRGGQ